MRLLCWYCKKSCSSELPSDAVIRGMVICPECIEKNVPEREVVKEFAEKVMADFDSNEEELDYNRCLLSVVNKLLKEYKE